ncbi:MAG: Metallophosphoesterase [uncultured bacterium (gcode 4)]|uniref:Metallophosphoesterase n=1 Tax=uncultured bacterium (gcode 4) TaxID=1234023 RepID=K2GF58_9BACT|nr:MAG: Metallophosphoesterase [uncultured bacterium (gcode 4)]
MSRLLFPIFAIVILWWLNALFLLHTFRFFWLRVGPWFYVLSLLLSLIFPISMILHNLSPNLFTRYLHVIWALWLWIIFLWLFVWILYDIIFYFWKNPILGKWHIWMGTMIILTIYGYLNQMILVTKEIEIPVKNLQNEIKIWYLSDVHIDWIHDLTYLDKIIDKLNVMDIDVVLINWDLVDGTSFEKHSFKNLERLEKPVFITFWNHESYVWNDYVMSLLAETKARVLHNEVVDFAWLQILWTQDLMWLDRKSNESKLEDILNRVKRDDSKPSLLMLHEPIWPELADKHGIDVQLAWHTHNWQIWPFTLIVKQFFPYMTWLHKVWDLSLYISPGSWVWWPPMRIGSRSEITRILLKKG